jgi:hypothetical protein
MEERRRCGGMFFKILGGAIVGLIVTAAFSLVIGAVVMVLWNWLMFDIFGLAAINYWQAFGIVLLAKLVFGGFGRHFMPPFGGRKWPGRHWGEQSKDCDEYAKRCREFARHRGFSHNWRLDDDYEEWWKNEGSKSFEEHMKKKDTKEEDTEDKA